MSNRGMNLALGTPQPNSTIYFVELQDANKATGTQAVADEGQGEVTIVRNNTGDYTLTPTSPGYRIMSVGNPLPTVANLQCQLVSFTDSTGAARIKFTDNSGVATDTGFFTHLAISYDILRR